MTLIFIISTTQGFYSHYVEDCSQSDNHAAHSTDLKRGQAVQLFTSLFRSALAERRQGSNGSGVTMFKSHDIRSALHWLTRESC